MSYLRHSASVTVNYSSTFEFCFAENRIFCSWIGVTTSCLQVIIFLLSIPFFNIFTYHCHSFYLQITFKTLSALFLLKTLTFHNCLQISVAIRSSLEEDWRISKCSGRSLEIRRRPWNLSLPDTMAAFLAPAFDADRLVTCPKTVLAQQSLASDSEELAVAVVRRGISLKIVPKTPV